MENASKALVIAGGILVTMMILSLLVYVGSAIGEMAESQDRQIVANQLKEFNASYLAYNKTRIYGTDVLSVYNKAKDEDEYNIEVLAIDKEKNIIIIENTQEFKMSVFECIEDEIDYDNTTGRINKMVYRKVEI